MNGEWKRLWGGGCSVYIIIGERCGGGGCYIFDTILRQLFHNIALSVIGSGKNAVHENTFSNHILHILR